MQRKRRNINFGRFSGSSGKSKFNNSITKLTLHSIPTVRMSESNKKSLIAERNPFCGINELYTNDDADIYQPTSVVWWRSRKATLRVFHVRCFGKVRVNSTFLSLPRVFRIPFGAVIQTRTSHIVMTPLSRLDRYLSFSRNLKLPLYIICTLLLSFVVSGMMSGFECYAAVNPTASLSVSNPTLSATVAPGDTAYLSSNVTYSASDIDSYTLQVSYANGYSSLKLDGGTTTLSGANGASGSSLANNSWGFAWTNNTTNNVSTNSGLTYYTMPTYGTNGSGLSTGRLEAATLPESSNNTLSSTTKRIVFAAKFAENNNNSGHYKTGIQLSMVATPRKVLGEWRMSNATSSGYDSASMLKNSGITTMQQMTSSICNQVSTPASSSATVPTMRLKDSRDGNEYIIAKYADGRCWMTENLRIYNSTIKAAESDFSGSDIPLPSSAKADFTDANKLTYRSILLNEATAGPTGYYNWYTATAGAGNSSVTTQNQNVNTSICPKGWTLPTGGSTSNANTASTWTNFYGLFRNMGLTISNTNLKPDNEAYTNWGSGDLAKVQAAPYNFKYIGLVNNGSLGDGTFSGHWWSSTVASDVGAYDLYISNSYVFPYELNDGRCYGFAVRCVARDS